jgi:hypothetical protein
MELHEALSQIDVIHRQMARTEKFRGYRALPTALGSVLAVVAGLLQPVLLPRPDENIPGYLLLWVGTAIVAGAMSAGDAWRRHRRDGRASGILIKLACEQFLPCVVAGGAVTVAVAAAPVDIDWMLPGLWAVIFSLGLFASLRLLPDAMLVPAAWYLIAGCTCLALGPRDAGLSPLTMIVLFGVGQGMLAAILARQPREVDERPARIAIERVANEENDHDAA